MRFPELQLSLWCKSHLFYYYLFLFVFIYLFVFVAEFLILLSGSGSALGLTFSSEQPAPNTGFPCSLSPENLFLLTKQVL